MRRTTLLGAALLLGVTVLGACAGEEDPGLLPESRPSGPEASPGQRYVGLGHVVVEVPDDWGTEVFDGCGRTPTGTVVFRLPDQRRGCGDDLTTRRSWLVLEDIAPDDSLLLTMRRGAPVDGARTRRTGIACLDQAPQVCSASVAVPGERFLAQVHVVDRDAEELVRRLLDSVRLLDDGAVVVPPIALGTSDEDALAILADAGLEGRIPEVDWPHYVTGSEPPPGTVVEVGSTVDLQIGDG